MAQYSRVRERNCKLTAELKEKEMKAGDLEHTLKVGCLRRVLLRRALHDTALLIIRGYTYFLMSYTTVISN